MLAITRRFRNGTVYVLDTDDMVCEDATISDIIEIEEKGYHVEHLADSIYSEKYGDIVFFSGGMSMIHTVFCMLMMRELVNSCLMCLYL